MPSSALQVAGYVDLNDLKPLPTPLESDVRPLRVAIAAVLSPRGSAESYGQLLKYLEKELDRPVEAVQRRTYSEVNDLLRTGEVDLAFVCTSAYILGKREFNMQLLVAPQVNGEKVYRAQLIVPADSPAQSISDLRGILFAFTDPMSFTGRIYPTYLLQQMVRAQRPFLTAQFLPIATMMLFTRWQMALPMAPQWTHLSWILPSNVIQVYPPGCE